MKQRINQILFAFLFLTTLFVITDENASAMPPAGTQILNQGTITYRDSSGVLHDTSTNLIILTVNQIYSASIEGDKTLYGASSQNISFFHILKNLGNGEDLFCIEVKESDANNQSLTHIKVIHDSNDNGIFDNGETMLFSSSKENSVYLNLLANQEASLLLIAGIPENTQPLETFSVIIYAKAQMGTGVCTSGNVIDIGVNQDNLNDTNEDTIIVSNNAILEIQKSSSYIHNEEGISDDTISYQIVVKNTGTIKALDVQIEDLLPEGTIFVQDSLVYTGDYQGSQLDDGNNGINGVEPHYDSESNKIVAEVDILQPDAQVSFSFIVSLESSLKGGQIITNTSKTWGNLDDNTQTVEELVESNRTIDEIPGFYAVEIKDTGAGMQLNVNDGGDDDGTQNDIQYVNSVNNYDKVLFSHIVSNNGNLEDCINIKVINTTFPSGTAFQFFYASFNTPLLDTDNDGHVDTGIIASQDDIQIGLKAIMPSAYSGVVEYQATIQAVSSGDPSKNDTTTALIETILSPVVDIANSLAANGFNDQGLVDADPVSQVITTITANPGETHLYNFYIANEGKNYDSYSLSVWSDEACTLPLSDDIMFQFINESGHPILFAERMGPGSIFHFMAQITIPEFIQAQDIHFFVKVQSKQTGAFDIKQDVISINEIESILLYPDYEGIVSPGSAIDYIHEIKNNGTTNEWVKIEVVSQSILNNVILFPTAFVVNEPGEYQYYQDFSVGDNVIYFDSTSKAWLSTSLESDGQEGLAIPLSPGDYTHVLIRVLAKTSIQYQANDILILKASVVDGTDFKLRTDHTTVAASYLKVEKKGALDADCNGVEESQFQISDFSAKPGDCFIWQIIVKNQGSQPACRVTVYDTISMYTSIYDDVIIHYEPTPGTGSCSVDEFNIQCNVGSPYDIDGDETLEPYCLKSGEYAEIRFGVKIK